MWHRSHANFTGLLSIVPQMQPLPRAVVVQTLEPMISQCGSSGSIFAVRITGFKNSAKTDWYFNVYCQVTACAVKTNGARVMEGNWGTSLGPSCSSDTAGQTILAGKDKAVPLSAVCILHASGVCRVTSQGFCHTVCIQTAVSQDWVTFLPSVMQNT